MILPLSSVKPSDRVYPTEVLLDSSVSGLPKGNNISSGRVDVFIVYCVSMRYNLLSRLIAIIVLVKDVIYMDDNNFTFFRENLCSLLESYNGMFIVIKDQCVIGAYSSFDEAYAATIKKEELGSFIIQHCTQDALKPSARFAWNNVVFSKVSV